jgi:hypothetical protein
MTDCSGCGKKIGMFSKSHECADENCDKVFCDACAKFSQHCKECGYLYCNSHLLKHDCEPDEEESEEEDEEEEKEYSDAEIGYIVNNMSEKQLLIAILLTKFRDGDITVEEMDKIRKEGQEGLATLFGD